jgi:hypothetical protein
MTYAQLYARSSIAPVQPLTEVVTSQYGSNAISYIRNAIYTSHPVAFGIIVPDDALDNGWYIVTPANPMCNGELISKVGLGGCAGHAMIITGYDDNARMFEVKNQWGTGWGDSGYGHMSYDYFTRYQAGPLMTIAPDANAFATVQPIQWVYEDTFQRNAMAWEVDAWVGNLAHNGWTLQSMRAAFATNAQDDDAIRAVYEETFGRDPAAWELSAWESNIRSGAWGITSMRSNFATNYQTPQAIAKVYADVLGRAPSSSESTTWQRNIQNYGWSIPMMRNSFANSQECANDIDATFVSKHGRHATSAEIRTYVLHIHDDLWTLAQVKAAI